MLPLIPILFALMGLSGIAGLVWYYSLSEADRQRHDQLAEYYASELFEVAVDKLTEAQARQVHARVKSHFN
jgi:hypothetical protein